MPGESEATDTFVRLFPESDLVEALSDDAQVAAFRGEFAAISTPDIEVQFVGPGDFSARGTLRGLDGLVEGWRDWLLPFATYRMELEPEVRFGADAVVLFARQIATPKGSDHEVTEDAAAVAFLRDGKVRRIEFHLDRAAALRSAGLADER